MTVMTFSSLLRTKVYKTSDELKTNESNLLEWYNKWFFQAGDKNRVVLISQSIRTIISLVPIILAWSYTPLLCLIRATMK